MKQKISFCLMTCIGLLSCLVPESRAAKVSVPAGTGTLQAAIDAASPGDTLVLGEAYYGPIVITKSLKFIGRKDSSPSINVSSTAIGIDIAASGVKFKRGKASALYVVTDSSVATTIRIVNQTKISLDAFSLEMFPLEPTEPTGVGIEVSGNVDKVRLGKSVLHFSMFAVGVHIHDVPAGADLRLGSKYDHDVGYNAAFNSVGLLIENSGAGAVLGSSGIRVEGLSLQNSESAAIRLVNSDGVRISKNELEFENFFSGTNIPAIDLDANSDLNLISGNQLDDATSMQIGLQNGGAGNCGANNNFAVPACP